MMHIKGNSNEALGKAWKKPVIQATTITTGRTDALYPLTRTHAFVILLTKAHNLYLTRQKHQILQIQRCLRAPECPVIQTRTCLQQLTYGLCVALLLNKVPLLLHKRRYGVCLTIHRPSSLLNIQKCHPARQRSECMVVSFALMDTV